MTSRVLARSSAGEPLDRIAMRASRALIFLANPASVPAIEAGDSFPVGFPARDCYAFDQEVFGRLMQEWRERGCTASETWALAQPFVVRGDD